MELQAQLALRGFAIARHRLDSTSLQGLQQALAGIGTVGVRNLAAKVPAVREFAAGSIVRALIEPLLGRDARLVRSIYFNKSSEHNWSVAWHRDLTIAVAARADLEGFMGWSNKEGVLHVQAPPAVLERMLTLRLHLDPADACSGALWVIPGSHRSDEIEDEIGVVEQSGAQLCVVHAGDVLLMRPRLLHASRKSSAARLRRVVHLEFAAADALPSPLQWAQQII